MRTITLSPAAQGKEMHKRCGQAVDPVNGEQLMLPQQLQWQVE